MALAWDGLLTRMRAGDVGGTFYYFDTEGTANHYKRYRRSINHYDEVELGQWLDSVWENNLRNR